MFPVLTPLSGHNAKKDLGGKHVLQLKQKHFHVQFLNQLTLSYYSEMENENP